MRPRAYFHGFAPVALGHTLTQNEAIRFAMKAMTECNLKFPSAKLGPALRLFEDFIELDAIDSRVSCVPDYAERNADHRQLFNCADPQWSSPSLERRMGLFREVSLAAVTKAFESDSDAPDYLIQISCTGYDSPHATQRLAAEKNWATRAHLLHIGHMGCYAALPVSAMSGNLVRGKQALTGRNPRASLIFVELCTLHFEPTEQDAQQIVMNTLFADGAIRFEVSAEKSTAGFALLEYAEEIIPDTADEMTWVLKGSSFGMTLGRNVPVLLKKTAPRFVAHLLAESGLTIKDVHCFAIHPGGPRIVDYLAEALGLTAEHTRHSREVLRTRGNMSSCTVPHIWEKILNDVTVPSGAYVVSLAFGPGLTIAGNILRKEI